MAYITEDWGSTLGTAGNYTWTKETAAWFGAGGRILTAADTYLREQSISLYDRGANKAALSLLNCSTQLHYASGTNTSIWYRVATAGTLSLWAIIDAWSGAQVEIQWATAPDNSTANPGVVAKGTLGAGTLIRNGTANIWYAGSSWYLSLSCTSNLGSARVGTVQYITTTFVPSGTVVPTVGIQNLGGTSMLQYSRWTADGPTGNGLLFNTGSEYSQTFAPTIAQLPSSLSFQGQTSMVSRYRGMLGSLYALNAHTEGFKCQCTMYWNQCSDATLALIGSLSLMGSNEIRISCSWGTFQSLYIPATFTYSRLLDDINTASISFLEVETI